MWRAVLSASEKCSQAWGGGWRWRGFEHMKHHLYSNGRVCYSGLVLVDSDKNATGFRKGKRQVESGLRQGEDWISCIKSLGLVLREESLVWTGSYYYPGNRGILTVKIIRIQLLKAGFSQLNGKSGSLIGGGQQAWCYHPLDPGTWRLSLSLMPLSGPRSPDSGCRPTPAIAWGLTHHHACNGERKDTSRKGRNWKQEEWGCIYFPLFYNKL